VNPEDLARRRWKAVNKKVEERSRLVRELNETNERLASLREELPRAEQADCQAFAAALGQGKAEPERQAEQISARITIEERRAEAAALGIENAERALRELCARNATWRGDTLRSIVKARLDYQEAIAALEAAREALGDEVSLIGWLANGDMASPVNDRLAGHVAVDGQPSLSFTQVLLALSADAEEIATHLREPEPRLPWTRIKDHAEALVGQGLSREEAVQHAGHTEWAGGE
jgi:hypothetical protein